MRKLHLILVVMAMTISACSTVNRGSTDHFRIDTVPQGATVTTSVVDRTEERSRKNQYGRYVDNTKPKKHLGCEPTPCAIAFPRRSEFVVTLEHPGYETTQIFIRNSTMRGGSTANSAANLATASGTGFAMAGMGASVANTFTQIFSLGTQTVNTSGIASSSAAAGLGVGAGMIAIDIATGANLNLFPNPVVIELTPEGTSVRKDPLVSLYWKMKELENQTKPICKQRKNERKDGQPTCKQMRTQLRQAKEAFQSLKKEQMETLKDTIKALKSQQKERELQ